jgi:hypothetical protein
MTSAQATPDVQFRFDLIGPWQLHDPAHPDDVGDSSAGQAVMEHLHEAGLLARPVLAAGEDLVLSASMIDPGTRPETSPPLIASVTVIRREMPVQVEVKHGQDGAIVPRRRSRTSTMTWPDDVGEVSFLHVDYAVPAPDGNHVFVVAFTSPNLPMRDVVEAWFDAMVSTARFVAA